MKNSKWYQSHCSYVLNSVMFRCVMALIWGSNGPCPCPVCLVPLEKQHYPSTKWKPCDINETQDLIKAAKQGKHSQWELLLKEQGLHKLAVFIKVDIILECILDCQIFWPIQSNFMGSGAYLCPWSWWKTYLGYTQQVYHRSWLRKHQTG